MPINISLGTYTLTKSGFLQMEMSGAVLDGESRAIVDLADCDLWMR